MNYFELQANCLNGGFIIQAQTTEEALHAENLGAVGILINPLNVDGNKDPYKSIFEITSVHVIGQFGMKDQFLRSYREYYKDSGPGYFIMEDYDPQKVPLTRSILLITNIMEAQSAIESGVNILGTTDLGIIPKIKNIRDKHKPYLPIFSIVESTHGCIKALSAGSDGLILNYSPTSKDISQIISSQAIASYKQDLPHEKINVGILALQGDYLFQLECLKNAARSLYHSKYNPYKFHLVRFEEDLTEYDALVLPGGWSNIQSLYMKKLGMESPLEAFHTSGKPILAICAGMVLAGSRSGKDCHNRNLLGFIDVKVENNILNGNKKVYLENGNEFETVFSNGPIATDLGRDVIPLAILEDGGVVAARERNVTIAAYHMGGGLHEEFLQSCQNYLEIKG